jgi:hypothetical protein
MPGNGRIPDSILDNLKFQNSGTLKRKRKKNKCSSEAAAVDKNHQL